MGDPFEIIGEYSSEEEAVLAAGKLQAEGLHAVLESRFFRAEPVTFGALGTILLRVPQGQVEEAKRLLAEFEDELPSGEKLRS